MKEIIGSQAQASFDRAHFKSFGDSSLNFELVYFIESADFVLYMDIHHAICLRIFEKFEQEKIEFAYPTQTLYVNSEEKVLAN